MRNFGTGVRASISKPTPFIYLAFEKTDPFIYSIIQNVDLFIYCPLIFFTHFLLVITQKITVNLYNTKRISSLEKSLSEKICAYTRMSEKWGLSHRNPEKSGHSYTFCWKKGANHIPGSAEKGGYSARTSVLCHIKEVSPPPPPPEKTIMENVYFGVGICHHEVSW